MINNVVLVGRLTKDAELRYTQSNVAVATFTLAVNRTFKSQSGEREADFINCVIWRQAAENLANWAKKGSLIGITGNIQTRYYDNQQGQSVYRDWETDRKSTRLNSSHSAKSRMPSSA